MAAEIPYCDECCETLVTASMGPQLIGCGDSAIAALSIVGLRLASMGPQLIGCGDVEGEEAPEEDNRASMGPQLIGCGDLAASCPAAVAACWLQWGRS